MILTHGITAAVESGFCRNSDMLVENLHESAVVVQRQIYDGIRYYGGVLQVEIAKAMLKSHSNSLIVKMI